MKLSSYFLPLIKENPSEAQIVSHRLMLRAGMIRQVTSGIYNWLPLGLAVLRKVENIVRDEHAKSGVNEMLMPTIQPADLWEESGRGTYCGAETLQIKDRHGRMMFYSPTNEELITDVFRNSVKSYKELPLNLYHIQWKFRDEIRPRFGVMRGREFLMKDAYSFDLTHEDAVESYGKYYQMYLRIFDRLGLVAIPLRAETGDIGGDLSHEFCVIADEGESALYYDKKFDDIRAGKLSLPAEEMRALYAAADEQHDADNCPVAKADLREARGIEVGHIFNFGTKYTKSMGATVQGPDGKPVYPECGSYGIGISRLVGALIEANHDDSGIIWPEAVAPFTVGLMNLRGKDDECVEVCASLYQQFEAAGVSVLYDDTDDGAGQKFAKMDLIGLPWQIAIGPRGVTAGTVELKNRRSGEKQEISAEAALELIQQGAIARAA
ncbi:MAG: proline--tRNA ligase [Rickettsiales bacterium]|nr:proline--tRNA ligase [Rickettsiales bacterium]